MKAIILAAGRGSRMQTKTAVLPKCLLELWGKTLLEHQLAAIRQGGITEIAVVTGYHAEEIRSRHPELTYFHNADWANTNMVATLRRAETWLESDTCLVSYADIVYTSAAVTVLAHNTDDIAITYYTEFLSLWQKRFVNPLDDLETFKIDAASYLTEIGQKPKSVAEVEGQYMGLLKFTPAGWGEIRARLESGEKLPKPAEKIDMTSLLSHLLTCGIKIRAVPYDELWLEADNEQDLALYEQMSREN